MARRRRATKRKEHEELVNPFAAQHGHHARESDDDREKEGKSTLIRNRWVTTVERWKSLALLSETQVAGIDHCEGLWDRANTSAPLVADLLRIPGMPGGNGWSQQEAIDELYKLKDRIPRDYWDVFENVCRFDEPGGTAGSRFANDDKRASHAALMCVRFVADMVAMRARVT